MLCAPGALQSLWHELSIHMKVVTNQRLLLKKKSQDQRSWRNMNKKKNSKKKQTVKRDLLIGFHFICQTTLSSDCVEDTRWFVLYATVPREVQRISSENDCFCTSHGQKSQNSRKDLTHMKMHFEPMSRLYDITWRYLNLMQQNLTQHMMSSTMIIQSSKCLVMTQMERV